MKQSKTLGAAASAAWIEQRGLDISHAPHWYVEASVPADVADTRYELNIYPEEWGVIFWQGSRASSIRVTDIAFVHGRDDHDLLKDFPSLDRIADLLALLERRYEIAFRPTEATVRSNLTRATAIVRPWLVGKR